jgi:cephalosporin hydroxylase
MNEFDKRNKQVISAMNRDERLVDLSRKWFTESSKFEYSYHFTWLGRPLIQFPQDIVAMQEIIWQTKPDLVIETGIAHGGSLIFYASMLELIGGNGTVLGIDIDIRPHNRVEIEKHPMFKRIQMFEGSSVEDEAIEFVYNATKGKRRIMVVLDSNHTHAHVYKELELYSPMVTKGSYLVVFDTIIDHMPASFSKNRPWGKNNNPKTAVQEFLKRNDRFAVDKELENKLLITVAPDGYLKCIKQ